MEKWLVVAALSLSVLESRFRFYVQCYFVIH
jgi:hypothetical protein